MTNFTAWVNNILSLLAPGWVGSLIGIVGLAAAIATFFLTRQRTALTFHCSGKRLLGLAGSNLPTGIKVDYNGRNIPRLTRSIITLWNSGEKTIDGDHIASSDPLKIVTDNKGTILSATILQVSRTANDLKCSLSTTKSNEVELVFSFLDTDDGAVIELLHTSEDINTRIIGTIKGIPKGINGKRQTDYPNNIKAISSIINPIPFLWIVLIIGLAAILLSLFFPDEIKNFMASSPQPELLSVYITGGLYVCMSATLLYFRRQKYPKSLRIDTDTSDV
ncbi:hypothetical protein OPV09_17545 [Janthinobacterium sp. TB1-E2]|uniref:Ig-like domain-containing protein n=1 Tax=Janthinobacterium aestuarii TaxID=2985511 RepID=A0ABZ2GGZ5_9BURK